MSGCEYIAGGGGVTLSGDVTFNAGDSTNGGDRGEEDRRLPSSEQDEAASEHGRFGSEGSGCVSGIPEESTLFRLHFDWPHARNPFANGLWSILSFVMRSFCGQGVEMISLIRHFNNLLS